MNSKTRFYYSKFTYINGVFSTSNIHFPYCNRMFSFLLGSGITHHLFPRIPHYYIKVAMENLLKNNKIEFLLEEVTFNKIINSMYNVIYIEEENIND